MIAMALACDPKLLIADEPTTALDVTIQAQVLKLMLELKAKTGAAIVLITHDLGVVAETCQRVVVMYAGPKSRGSAGSRAVCPPRAPLHARLARLDRARQSRRARQAAERNPGHGAVVARADAGLCLCTALPVRHRRLPAAATGAEARRRRAASPGRLFAPRGGAGPMSGAPILNVKDLKKHFQVRRGLLQRTVAEIKAVDGVLFRAGSRGNTMPRG